MVWKSADGLAVRDLDSRNGIAVNGKSVKTFHLEPGDVLSVGGVEFRIATGAPAAAEEPARSRVAAAPTIDLRGGTKLMSAKGASVVEWTPGFELVPGCVLQRRLAAGAFGEVWKARKDGFGELAIKRIRVTDPVRNEARALRAMKGLRHRYLARVYAYRRVGDLLIVAMELGDETLQDRFEACQKQGTPGIPQNELLKYLRQVGEALDYLYFSRNMLHRDVKPSNLLLVRGTAKVCDFGLGKVLENLQAEHSGVLTFEYAPPEFLERKMVASSDQFSLAATYCYLLTGTRPFAGASAREIIMSHAMGNVSLDAVPAPQRPVLMRALARNPADRFLSCSHFVIALRRAAKNKSSL
jgi:serine/threonine protein kinase